MTKSVKKLKEDFTNKLNKPKRWTCRQQSQQESPIQTEHGRTSKEKNTWYQNHTSKTIETKSKTIRPKRLQLNSYEEPYETDFFQTWHRNSWREQKKLDRPWLRIVHERRIMKRFAAIEFKQKWIMPFCSPTHLALDWYWTLIAQIDLRLSNRLVNINHLNLPRQIFSSVFCSRQEFLSGLEKISHISQSAVPFSNVSK